MSWDDKILSDKDMIVSGLGSGIDEYTKLMLHMDGADQSTTFTDSASPAKIVTPVGDAQIDTAISKFGGASGIFDGTGDYLSTPNHADFDFASGDFSIDFWIYAGNLTGLHTPIAKDGTGRSWAIQSNGSNLTFGIPDGAVSGTLTLSLNQWMHVYFGRSGNTLYRAVNGALSSEVWTATIPTTTEPVWFARQGSWNNLFIGNLDEIRISKGIARWTANFIPPASAYSDIFINVELGNDQELITQGAKFTVKMPRAKPNALAGLASLVLGSVTSTQDPGKIAYVHKIIPVAVGTVLPSVHLEEKFGDLQYKYFGVKGNTLKISGEEGGLIALEAGLIGSGTRATSANTFPAAITESWLHLHDCKVWLETGANISITSGAVTQDAEDISNDTPDVLSARMKSFELTWDNKLEGQEGFGGLGVLVDADYGRRAGTLKMQMLFNDGTELAYYTAQNPVAIEFDLKGSLIAVGGTLYYGVSIIVPRMKMKPAPLPKGGPNDTLVQNFEFEIFDDGTNPAIRIDCYNAQAAYLAA